ncbi:MAG TPA: histidine kinase [Thermoanaerobaculia bacterium]
MTRSFWSLLRLALLIVVLWLAYGLYNASEFHRRFESGPYELWLGVLGYQLWTSLVWATFTPLIIGIAERLPLRKPNALRNALLLMAIAPIFSVIRAAIGAGIMELTEKGRVTADFIVLCINIRFHRNIFVFLTVAGIVNLILLYRAVAERERNALAMRTALANAETERLRTALQPRLMFATLDAIGATVTASPGTADRMLVSLGGLLRMKSELGRLEDVALAEELDVVDRYLEIEKTRTQGTFTSRIDVDERLLGARVPPLLLQGLVEASLLGGDDGPSHLEIHGRAEGAMLRLEFVDDRHERVPSFPGLVETKSRVQQLFGSRGSVEWRRERASVVTTIAIPLRLMEATA